MVLSFENLSKSILSLFVLVPTCGIPSYFTCEKLLNERGNIDYGDKINSFIGEIDEFHDWLKPKLEELFNDFNKYFFTSIERMNRRRMLAYEDIVKCNWCNRLLFKRQMMKELKIDMDSYIKNCRLSNGEIRCTFLKKNMDTEEGRRLVFFKCIKDYVHRLFLINDDWFLYHQ